MDTKDNTGFTPEADALVEQLVETLRILDEHDSYMRALLDEYEKRVVERLLAVVLVDNAWVG